jgi:hypothetical protein
MTDVSTNSEPTLRDHVSSAEEPASEVRSRFRLGSTASLAMGAVGVASIRWLLAIARRTTLVYFDETAQLAIARTVAGGSPWRLFDTAAWQPGFGILISPLYVLTDDTTTVYRLVLVVNCILGGCAFVLLALLGREVTGRRLEQCVIPAAVVSILPAAIVASAYAWSEQLLIVLALAAMLSTMRFLRSQQLLTGSLSIGLSALGYLTHSRLLPLAAVTVVTVLVVFVRGREWRNALLSTVWTVVAFSTVLAIVAAIHRRVWTDANQDNTVRSTLTRLEDPLAVLDAAVGQAWYLMVGSLGFVAFGALAVWRLITNPERRAASAILVAVVVTGFATSVLFMSDRVARSDMLIYGRYNEALIGPVLLVGWFEFVRRVEQSRRDVWRTVVLIGGAAGALALVVHALHRQELAEGTPFRVMIPALAALDSEVGTRVLPPTLISLAVLAMLTSVATAAGAHSRLVGLAVGLVACIGVLRVGSSITYAEQTTLSADGVEQLRDAIPPGETVVLRAIPPDLSILWGPSKQRASLQLYQSLLPEQPFELDNGDGELIDHYILAPELTTSLVESDAHILWKDPISPMALWYIP